MLPGFYPLFRMFIPFPFSLFSSFCRIGCAFRHFAAAAPLSVILPYRLRFPSFCLTGSAFRHFALPALLSASLPQRLCFPPVYRSGSAFRQFAALASLSASLSQQLRFYRNNHVTVQNGHSQSASPLASSRSGMV